MFPHELLGECPSLEGVSSRSLSVSPERLCQTSPAVLRCGAADASHVARDLGQDSTKLGEKGGFSAGKMICFRLFYGF